MANLISLDGKFSSVFITLLCVFTSRIHAGHLKRMLEHRLPADVQPKNHVTSFARFGRQGNFVRIGRPILGRLDDKKFQLSDEYVVKEQLPRLIQIMKFYPHHFHRFIRIGRNRYQKDFNGEESHLDKVHFSQYTHPNENKMELHDQAKKTSSFVRIGRNGMSPLQFSTDDSLGSLIKQTKDDAHENKYDFAVGDTGQILVDLPQQIRYSHKRNEKRKNSLVPIFFRKPSVLQSRNYDSSSRDLRKLYFLTNDVDISKTDQNTSRFVKKSKIDYKDANDRLIDNNRMIPWSLKKFGTQKIRLEKENIDDRGKSSNFRQMSFGHANDNVGTQNLDKNKQDFNFIRTGRTAKGNSNGFDSSLSNFIHSRQDFSQNDPATFLQIKKSSPLFNTSTASSENEVAYPDSPIDAANRRSAFVRIGKIPSSAFVRIGKNFDRVFQLPVAKDSFYSQRFRKGRSSFVRIG